MLGIRSRNLYLLRYFYEGLGNLAKEITSIANEAALIKMGQGKKEITDEIAREIEENLNLPRGWMDRDNDVLIKMSTLDYRIHKKISSMTEERKCSLVYKPINYET